MKKINNNILSLILVVPMLVMLAHDIIPHHHHNTHTSANFVNLAHNHIEATSVNCHGHGTTQQLAHSHQENESSCCSFVNLRFFKDFKFQVILTHIILDMLKLREDSPIKHYVSNFSLIPEPYRESSGLRGPPQV
ncbi:hypothetical protein EO244_14165 [Ancylomarina salipaludis]|uniref:Uncharacterized protein n=1 Tax=Ancylomarina salipaludis TaxID=2501299 RepID=A0A4Q1JIP6_9BACT|nr:hypothetical protein [Ancylomarina salipaludis]RXQ89508.1 hypothetical protein EO244_14165 [Ancylomarina salipaludis]